MTVWEREREELTCVEPVSWFSKKVTAREGHHPMTPGGFPAGSINLQYSLCNAEWSIPCMEHRMECDSFFILWFFYFVPWWNMSICTFLAIYFYVIKVYFYIKKKINNIFFVIYQLNFLIVHNKHVWTTHFIPLSQPKMIMECNDPFHYMLLIPFHQVVSISSWKQMIW